MAFTVNEFISNINSRGVAYKSDFEVRILPRQGFRSEYIRRSGPAAISPNAVLEDLTFRIEATELPGRAVQTIDYRDHGVLRKIGYNAQYSDVGITIICSEDLREREFFDIWQDIIVGDHRSLVDTGVIDKKFNAGYYDDYICDMELIQYNRQTQKETYKVKLEEVYPLQISPLQVAWSDGEVHKLSITLAYRYYTVKKKQYSQAVQQRAAQAFT
jgi:hypothetical protein